MSLNFGLRLEQNQKLIMTPELRQAIKILQLSAMELNDYVNQMITDNPLVEVVEDEQAQKPDKKETEIDWSNFLQDLRELSRNRQPREVKDEFPFEKLFSHEISLQEYLISQLGLLSVSEQEYRIARYLIGNVDSAGYLTVTPAEAAADLKTEESLCGKVLQVIQGFDPPGVCATNLCECLLLQLKMKGLNDPLLIDLVKNHLENIAAGKMNRVAQCLNISINQVQELADVIKSLNPKPGASFGGDEEIRYIVPDVIIERLDDEYVILVNDGHVPRLTINHTYSSILNKNSNVDEETRDFVENKLNQAVWLIRSIEQRRSTIYQVTENLVKMQREFFDQGIKHLKPLTLKQVAEKVGVHESTVSRATSNKYLQTPHGIFEFKFFFTSGLTTDQGDSASSESIKRSLQEIIKGEESTKPYSDQKLADIMKSRGINIARRTVTKYREELGIPNTGLRRRY